MQDSETERSQYEDHMNGIYKPNRLGRLTHDNFFNNPKLKLPPMGPKPSQYSGDSLYDPSLDKNITKKKNANSKNIADKLKKQADIEHSVASSAKTIVKNRTGVSFRPSKGSVDKLGQNKQKATVFSRHVVSNRLMAFDHLKEIYVDSRCYLLRY